MEAPIETNDTKTVPARAEVSEWMIAYVVSALGIQRDDFSPEARFDSYGLDSAELVIMTGIMEEQFNIEIDPELLFETPTVTGVLDNLVAAGTVRP
ncbi:phosphopantetheine-binding protein [Acuticoccus sediminis]|uniref:Phosphopantetheine-binding protein n=1 Tax=Acuticoccus sediminis TaxID=2184697 RepID=A0A8B2NWL3_9HYPH|nr:acyl carrier protein [Acuticoccus sediminis]RAI00087.1 phosphopantetheine-binding protein [Acuticoccus sediminis]